LTFGMSAMPALRFAVFNALGAVLWAGLVGGAGWFFGQAAETLLGEVRHAEGWLVLALLVIAALGWCVQRWSRRRAQVRARKAE
jgi:membrane protein DedA with SNARE-associated domain